MDVPYRTKRDDHRSALLAATVRVSARDGSGRETMTGTGFFVTESWVLTASHVVPEGTTVYVLCDGRELPARVLDRKPPVVSSNYDLPDVALLDVAAAKELLHGHGCIELTDLVPGDDDELYAYGWPVIGDRSTQPGIPMQDGMLMRYDSPRGHPSGLTLFLTKGRKVEHGASGAPVIHLERGIVVGIVKLSRDLAWDAGAVLLPTKAILAAFPGYQLSELNAEATRSVDSVETLRLRFGRVLNRIRDTLAGAEAEWRQSMLEALVGGSPPAPSPEELALTLLDLRLEQLRGPLKRLARIRKEADRAQQVLRDTACCSWVHERPWVEPHGAALLAEERAANRPRVVHVPCADRLTGRMYVGRAATRDDWAIAELTTPDAEADQETGLPARLLHAIRAELLDNLTDVADSSNEEAVRRLWGQRRDDALDQARDLLLVLPPGTADQDAELLLALRQEFPGCTFAIFAPSLAPGLGAAPDLMPLPASLPPEDEAYAVQWYHDTACQLRKAAEK
ncbi:serine protease [Kitasatospora sp. NPDC048365]|uniref:S1 family peptidase n=1 Tax=Kitasatospora sp. NPDC048365 TaxID=3364050 RepID=UPI003718F42B